MKKTISVDIHGQNFIIDEMAYARLNDYLEDIKKHFGSDTNVEEVMSDIEASISEKLQSTITSFKNVVTLEDIEELIRVMGTAKDFDDAIGEETKEEKRETDKDHAAETVEPRVKRKLYRDTENAMLAGVAAGLAKYFDVDPVLIRIFFVIFTFTGGFAIPLYIILWIVMPEAKTVNQKLEMEGQAPTLSSLERMTQQKEIKHEKSTLRKILEVPFVILRAIIQVIKKIWEWIKPIFRILIGSILIIGSLIGLGALGVGAAYALLNINAPYKFSYIPISELANTVPFVWILVTGFFSLAIPTLFFLVGGISLIRKKAMLNFITGAMLIGFWMICGITCAAVSLRYIPDAYNKITTYPLLQEEQCAIDSSDVKALTASGSRIQIILNSGTSTEAIVKGRKVDLDKLDIKKEGERLTISQKNNLKKDDLCIGCEMHTVTITMNADELTSIDALDHSTVIVNGNLKNNPTINAKDGANIFWNDLNGHPVSANLSNQVVMNMNGKASLVTLVLDDSEFYAPTSESQTMIVTSKGESTGVLGTLTKLNIGTSEGSRILYAGAPKISGDAEKDRVISYRVISRNDYERFLEQEVDEDVLATSTVISNGTTNFFVERGSLSETIFQSFIQALRSSGN